VVKRASPGVLRQRAGRAEGGPAQPSTPVDSCGAPTGLDSVEPRWTSNSDSTNIYSTARNSDCQFCRVRFQKSAEVT
jgi:hypothetical protein